MELPRTGISAEWEKSKISRLYIGKDKSLTSPEL